MIEAGTILYLPVKVIYSVQVQATEQTHVSVEPVAGGPRWNFPLRELVIPEKQ